VFTTLNKIREQGPCTDGWELLLRHLGKTKADDEPLSLLTVLDSNGLDDTLWCFQAVDGFDSEMRLYAVWCARQVQHLMTDLRSLAALDVAERHALGKSDDDELKEAWSAALSAALSAARSAARAALSAALSASEAAAARSASKAAARSASKASKAAARSASKAAARSSVASQEAQLRKLLEETSNVSPIRTI